MAKHSKKKQKLRSPESPRVKRTGSSEPLIQREWFWALGLIVATLLAYQAMWHAGFIWDDDANITANTTLRSDDGLWRIWMHPGATQQYYPLTYTTFWLEYHLWQLNPLGYHLDNVLLHICNALLLGLILRKLEVPGAWLAAAFFALHPVNIDSVAWSAERKNTLSGLFYLGSLLAAVEFWKLGVPSANSAKRTTPQWKFYGLALILYLAALGSKTATVPLPMVILLLIWWKRPGLELRDIYLMIPFFIVGLGMGLITIWVERHFSGTTGAAWAFSLPERFILIGKQIWFYLGKLICPWPLIFVYSRWILHVGHVLSYLPSVALLGGMLFLWFKRNTQWRPVFVAATYFILLLLPASALFNQYYFLYSFVSNHFQYLASIGPLTLAAAGITSLLGRVSVGKTWLKPLVCGILLSGMGTWTWLQAQTYENSEILWKTTFPHNPTCWLGYDTLGCLLQQAGRLSDGEVLLKEALRIKPDDDDAHNNLGSVYGQQGRMPEAIDQFQQAVKINPGFAEAHSNLGNALQLAGHLPEAMDQYKQAIQLKPDYADAHNNMGNALLKAGQMPKALHQFQEAVRLRPDNAEAYNNIGSVLAEQGHTVEALDKFREALQIDPNNTDAQKNLARVEDDMKSGPTSK